MRAQVTIETSFDPSIVPRGVDDPVYDGGGIGAARLLAGPQHRR